MEQLSITQTRSPIGGQDGHRRTLRALGLRRIHQTVTQPDRPEIRGMVAKVAHLVEVAYGTDGEDLDLEPGQEPKGEGNPPAGASVDDDESAERAEATEEALAVEGSVEDVGDLVDNPPSLSSSDDPTPPKPRARVTGNEDDDDQEPPGETSGGAGAAVPES